MGRGRLQGPPQLDLRRAGTGRPNLITNVATTAASVPGAAMTEPVHDMLSAAGLLPAEHAVDAGYASADLPLGSRDTPAGAFAIDWDHQLVTSP